MDEADQLGQGENNPQGNSTGNPSWEDFLQFVPEDKYSQAQEFLSERDKGIQENFISKKVHSEYEPYKPFIENKISFEDVAKGYDLWTALQTNPKEFYDTMTEWLGIEDNGGQSNNSQSDPKGEPEQGQNIPGYDPAKIQQMEDMLSQVAQYVVADRTAKEQREADEQFSKEIESLQQKWGKEFNDDELKFIIGMSMAGADLEDALKALSNIAGAPSKPNAPFVLGSGGNFPGGQKFDPKGLSDKDRRSHAVAMLQELQRSQ